MKYIIYKDNQVVGHVRLTTEQKDILNNIPDINISISPDTENESVPDKTGKYLWARIGVGFHVSDELHQKIKEAMDADDSELVRELLDQAECRPVSYTHLDVYKRQLEYNGYQPIRRLTKDLWLVKKIGNKLDDVEII